MTKTISIYLDLARFLAAFTVFAFHARYERYTSGWLEPFGGFGNDAVMVFFVLSGFVIAHVAATKETNIREFSISRFSRLYSVVFPALILTIILDQIGRLADVGIYSTETYEDSYPVFRTLANLFFVNELWFLSIRPFSNAPFWSIGYEFWYYVLFAVLFYFRSNVKWLVAGLIAALVGPKMLLLLPVWWMGVAAYKISVRKQLAESVGWLLFIGSIVAYILFREFDGPHRLTWRTVDVLGHDFVYHKLKWSKYFLSSYVEGALVAANFIGIHALSHRLHRWAERLEKPIRFLAGYTFTLYLLHYPLLQFYAAIIHNDPGNSLDQVFVLAATLLTVAGVGQVTEKKKKPYRLLFHRLIQTGRARP